MQGVAVRPGRPLPESREAQAGTARPSALVTLGPAERRALLLTGDLVALNGALAAASFVLPHPTWLRIFADLPGATVQPEWFAVLTVYWLVAAALTDCLDLSLAGSRFASPFRVVWVTLLVMVAYYLTPIVTPWYLKSRLVWALLTLLAVGATALWRVLYASLVGHAVLTHKVVILGSRDAGKLMAEALLQKPASGLRPIGLVSDGVGPVEESASLPLLGSVEDLPRVLEQSGADHLIVATNGAASSDAYRAITAAYESGVTVAPMVQVYEALTGQVPVQHVGDDWVAVLPQGAGSTATYALVKRALDVAGGLAGLLLMAVVLPFIALAVLLDSGRPIFFSQERVGKRGRTFRIYKLRTVPVASAPNGSASIWDRKATTPTRLGRWLRRMRLDELPQFWNIVRGDMSLVGPRPFVAEEVDELQRHIPFFRCRLLVRPGLTGWAQVNRGYGTTLDDELAKLQYDLYYIRHRSVALDLYILIRTISVVARLTGR